LKIDVCEVSETTWTHHCVRPPEFGAVVGVETHKCCKNRAGMHVDHCANGGQKVGAVVVVGAVVGRDQKEEILEKK
jgi:hypothetical protein